MENTGPNKSKGEKLPLRDLFPELSEEQLKEVEDIFYGYLEIAWRIYERLERERSGVFDTEKHSS